MASDFEWTKKREIAALSLSTGHTRSEAAEAAGVSERSVYLWLNEPEFAQEVDRLSLMVEIASRAHRLRIANRVIRQMIRDGEVIPTAKDILDWLKYSQGETDGLKLNLMRLIDESGDGSSG